MGIRTTCPNGHRLNLKAFLAGKVGICPHCGARFRIPVSSEPIADPPRDAAGKAPRDAPGEVTDEAPGTELARSPTQPTTHTSHWYVCLPDRQTYGPVARETIDSWMAEGRITQDSLLWCEGWPDWRPAAMVGSADIGPVGSNQIPLAAPQLVAEEVPVSEQIRRRRKKHALSTTLVTATILTVVSLALVGVLLWVLR